MERDDMEKKITAIQEGRWAEELRLVEMERRAAWVQIVLGAVALASAISLAASVVSWVSDGVGREAPGLGSGMLGR